jgi:fatty acid desaturase
MRAAQKLPPRATWRPCPRYAIVAVARNVLIYLGSLASVPILAIVHPWAPLAAMPFVGLAMYRLTFVMHDCSHGTLFKSPKANWICGVLVGAMSGIEFHAYQRLHRKHHASLGQPDDPQGPDYLSLPASTFGVAYHLVRPLLGYNVFKIGQVVGALEETTPHRPAHWARLAPVIVIQGCAAAVASYGFVFWWLAPLPIVSAATFGLFFAQLRGLAEHVAMPGQRAAGCVRSHRQIKIDVVLLYDLNFNYHHEHHLYPRVPSCHLPELHRRLASQQPNEFALASGMFSTIWSRLVAGINGNTARDRA